MFREWKLQREVTRNCHLQQNKYVGGGKMVGYIAKTKTKNKNWKLWLFFK